MAGNNTEVDILMAVQELQGVKAATIMNILKLAQEYNSNVSLGDVRQTLSRGVKDGYLTECSTGYTLKEGRRQQPERYKNFKSQ